MSVVGRKFAIRNEVETVTSTTIFPREIAVTAGRPVLDTLVERVALSMLRWSEHRAQLAAITAESESDFTPCTTTFRSAHERAIDAGRTPRNF
jgi:hypothetical protein